MIITTTNTIEGKQIREYKGIVYGEVISGINFLKDIGAGLRNILGGRSRGYEEEIQKARIEALEEMQARAAEIGANAIVGVSMEYETFGADNGMVMVGCNGTAVVID